MVFIGFMRHIFVLFTAMHYKIQLSSFHGNALLLYIYVVLRIRGRWHLLDKLVSFTFHELVNFFAIRVIDFDGQNLQLD